MISPSVVSTSKHVAKCKIDGVARIPEVFTVEEVDRMRAEALLALTKNPQIEIKDGFPTILYNPPSDYLQELQHDERLRGIVREYYGHDNFELETQQWYFHLPGDPDEFNWHTDERFRPGVANKYLQTAILIDDWTEENSAVEFILGSHKKVFENSGDLRKFDRRGKRGVQVLGKAGDVLTWSNTVVHGSERNISRNPRAYYMHGFRSKDGNNSDC